MYQYIMSFVALDFSFIRWPWKEFEVFFVEELIYNKIQNNLWIVC